MAGKWSKIREIMGWSEESRNMDKAQGRLKGGGKEGKEKCGW